MLNKFKLQFNEILMEVVDDFYEDGVYGFNKKGAREFIYYDGLICHNIMGSGGTHSHVMKALMNAGNAEGIKSGETIEVNENKYRFDGDVDKIKDFPNKGEEDIILGRHWEVPSERADGKKLIAFWITDSGVGSKAEAVRHIRQRSDEYKDIGQLLNIDYRDYYIHVASVYEDISLYFKFDQFRQIIK